jgi:hypothetical protein
MLLQGCHQPNIKDTAEQSSAEEVKAQTARTWKAYKAYAWGSDVLLPISKGARNWYAEPLYISPIDAYSTLHLMGFSEETKRIEHYVTDSLDFDKDIFVKVFEVNIRVLGGLLSMYQLSGNPAILEKATDFADRLMPAFRSGTGIPHYWVNLRTGEAKGDTVNMAEAGTYVLEMGVLSYYTENPEYYQAAKKATRAAFDRRSGIGLIGERMDIESGQWTNTNSHICAGIDSYYEYMYKAWHLFGDPEMKMMWDSSIRAINAYIPEIQDSLLWYGRVDMHTGDRTSSVITLYDAFFPAVLALSGDLPRAEQLQQTWDWLWNKYGLEPMVYDYSAHKATYPVYDLNPEIIESAYYLYHFTGKQEYRQMVNQYFSDLKTHCMTEIAFTAVENVETMEKRDYMATYFLAETLKYLYLAFLDEDEFNLDDYVFTTEAHPFRKDLFQRATVIEHLGLE